MDAVECAVLHVRLTINSNACPQHHCPTCAAGKQNRDPFPPSCVSHALDLVHIDLSGPAHVPGTGGVIYHLMITDDFTPGAGSSCSPTSVRRPS